MTKPLSTNDTTRISIVVNRALPAGRLGGQMRQLVDDAGLDQRPDHDKQAGEEQQGFPFDAGQVIGMLQPGNHDENAGAQQRHQGRFRV